MKNPYASIPKLVWIISLVSFISKSGNVILLFFPIFLINKLNINIINVGQILSSYGIGAIIGSYCGGYFSNKLGYHKVQIYCLLLASCVYFSLEFCVLLPIIIGLLFLAGFFGAAIRPATAEAILAYCSEENRSRAYALNYQAINLGNTIGPAMGGILISFNYSWIFRMEGLANLFAGLVLLFFVKNNQTNSAKPAATTKPNFYIWKDVYFLLFIFFILLIGICFFQLFSTYPVYLKEYYTFSETNLGTIMAINGALIIIMQAILLEHVRLLGPLRLIGIGGFLISFGFSILPFHTGYYYAALSITIITIGEMLALPVMNEFVAIFAPENRRGQYFGLLNTAFSLPLVIAPWFGTLIFEYFSPNILWFSIGIIGFFILISFELMNLSPNFQKNQNKVIEL